MTDSEKPKKLTRAQEIAEKTGNVGMIPREPRPSPFSPRTGPGLFLEKTLGREAAEERANKAEAELADLKNLLESASTQGTRKIKIKDLVLVPGRQRKLSKEKYADLKQNLSQNTLVSPVTVHLRPDGKHELVAGYNRVQIYSELGREEIDADIRTFAENDIIPASFYSNLFAVELTDFEKYQGFLQLRTSTNKDQATMARESGKSEALISNIFAYDKLPGEVKELLTDNPALFGADTAAKLASATATGNDTKVVEGVKKLISGELKTEAQLAQFVIPTKVPAPKVAPIDIALGRQKKFVTISQREGNVTVSCKDVDFAERFKPQLIKLMKELIEQEKLSKQN